MFIELDSSGKILAYAEFRFNENCVETTLEIVRGKDGKLYFSGEEPAVNELEDRKKEIIFEREKKLENLFYREYPLHKQNNIGIYGTEEERLTFKNFHDAKVVVFDNFVALVNGCEDFSELDELCSSSYEE
jgi:hypothetical protein